MDLSKILFLIICGIGTFNSLLLGIYLLFNKKGNRLLNSLFALIILSFTVRVSKAIWVVFFEAIHPFFHILWYTFFIIMIFTFFIYIVHLTNNSTNIYKHLIKLLSFILLITLLLYIADFYEGELKIVSMILGSMVISMFYSAQLIKKYYTGNTSFNKTIFYWLLIFSLFVFIIWFIYTSIFFIPYNVMIVETYLFCFFIYIILYVEIRYNFFAKIHLVNRVVFTADEKIINQLKHLMDNEKIYLDPDLSLPLLAKSLKSNQHYISKLLNEKFGLNFNDYLNRYRINEAKTMLINPDKINEKIISIAFDCGFNSVSVFYSAFKKFTKQTPSAFKSLHLK